MTGGDGQNARAEPIDCHPIDQLSDVLTAVAYRCRRKRSADVLINLPPKRRGLGGRFVLGISVPKQRFDANFGRYLAALQNVAKINS